MKSLLRTGLLTSLLTTVACVAGSDANLSQLWDSSVAAANDGVYVRLPGAELVLRITATGSIDRVELDGVNPSSLVTSPDGSRVLVFGSWLECKDDDDSIIRPEDCQELARNSVLQIVQDGSLTSEVEIPSHLNTLAFSNDGEIAVAYLDYQNGDDIDVSGFADLGEVAFIRLADGSTGSASVGFSPSRVLFSPDGQAVVMSRSQVVAVDLTTFERTLEAPLTLDADQTVDPSGAELAFDAESGSLTLLLTVAGSSDLYMLDLVSKFWNIGDLGAVPSSVGVDNQSKKTVFSFAGSAKAMVLNHSNLSTLNASSLESYTLEEPANQVAIGDGFAVLYNNYNRSVHDVYHLNLETNQLTEYVVANPVSELQLTQSGSHAVAVLSPENSYGSGIDYYQDSRWGLAVMDLSSDESVSLVAETRPVGLALVEGADTAYALALLEGSETLLQVDLSNPTQAVPVELPSPAVAISAMPDGQFVISHDQGLGMISVLDPETLELNTTQHFAAIGLLENSELPRLGEEE